MSKKEKIINWKEYNAALKKRGDLTIWIDKMSMKHFFIPKQTGKNGRLFQYSDNLIELIALR